MKENMEERLLDLLCKKATLGLTPDEAPELRELESKIENRDDLHSLELTAAAISLTSVRPEDRLPDHLKSAILASADKHFSKTEPTQPPVTAKVTRRSRPIWGWLGWAAAAVACVALALNIWLRPTEQVVQGPPVTLQATEKRAQFMQTASDMVKAEWALGNVKELTGLTGDVVWSDSMQEGYLRFHGLPKNDTTAYTYQLWIFDDTQDPKTPIDGGIFDVNEEGEIVIPIDASLKARNPKAFAVTMEKPGGVMVSDRRQVVALASVKPNQV